MTGVWRGKIVADGRLLSLEGPAQAIDRGRWLEVLSISAVVCGKQTNLNNQQNILFIKGLLFLIFVCRENFTFKTKSIYFFENLPRNLSH